METFSAEPPSNGVAVDHALERYCDAIALFRRFSLGVEGAVLLGNLLHGFVDFGVGRLPR